MSKVSELASMLAKKGRNGDSILVHMNPVEKQILDRMAGIKGDPKNPETGLSERPFWIPFLTLLAKAGAAAAAASGASAVVNKIANGNAEKRAAEAATRSQQELKARNQSLAEKYRIPLLEMQPVQQQPGYMPGVMPEQFIAPIQKPVGWASPSGQFGSYAEGGMIPEQEEADSVLAMLQQQMGTGQLDPQLLNRAIEIYGEDKLAELLGVQNQQNEAMASGGLLRGPGKGMDDLIPGRIQGKQEVALAGGEYVVPADVTAMIGDGSSDAGGRALDAMVARVRVQKTGSPQQAGKINHRAVMPA